VIHAENKETNSGCVSGAGLSWFGRLRPGKAATELPWMGLHCPEPGKTSTTFRVTELTVSPASVAKNALSRTAFLHFVKASLVEPLPGFVLICFYSVTILIHHGDGGHGALQSLLGSLAKPFQGFL